jgi:hypothetical protein
MACEATRPVIFFLVVEHVNEMRTSPPSKLNGLNGEVEEPPKPFTLEEQVAGLEVDILNQVKSAGEVERGGVVMSCRGKVNLFCLLLNCWQKC